MAFDPIPKLFVLLLLGDEFGLGVEGVLTEEGVLADEGVDVLEVFVYYSDLGDFLGEQGTQALVPVVDLGLQGFEVEGLEFHPEIIEIP